MNKKKTKLKDLSQIDAKEEKAKPTTLDQIWGDSGLSKYNTMDFEEYKARINSMNRTDIQAHAVQIGMLPTDNHQMLIARLEREFLRHIGSYSAPGETKQKNTKIPKEVQKILAEGR
jgi:hypothetical protein